MAVTTIPWNDGSGDNIYLTYTSASGDQTVEVSSDANTGSTDRTKSITFTASHHGTSSSKILPVTQEGVKEPYIVFADPLVEQICATNWGDGTGIRPSQAAAVTATGTVFKGQAITSFDELGAYFTGLTTVSGGAFQNCTSLESIVFPSSVTTFSSQCLAATTGLKSLTINSNVGNLQLANANAHVGDGTGTMLVNGNLDKSYSANGPYFDFKIIHVTGNITYSTNGSAFLFRSSYTEQLIIDGNFTGSYTLCASTALKFLDIGGTYSQTIPPNGISNLIVHLRYNGVAGTPNRLRMNTANAVSKVYVDSATILAAYQADSAWSAYSAKLDLWENYNGTYKD